MNQIKIAITMATHNNINLTTKCIDSILKRNSSEISIVIIDNGSTDNTVEILNKNYPMIHVVKNSVNFGCAPAWNQGITACKTLNPDYIFLTQNDVMFSKNCFDILSQFLEENDDIEIVSPICLNNNNLDFNLKELDILAERIIEKNNKSILFPFVFYGFMARKRVYNKVMFDSNFKIAHYEDTDFYNKTFQNEMLSCAIGKCFMFHKYSSTQNIVFNPFTPTNYNYFKKKWNKYEYINNKIIDNLKSKRDWIPTTTMDKYPGCILDE